MIALLIMLRRCLMEFLVQLISFLLFGGTLLWRYQDKQWRN